MSTRTKILVCLVLLALVDAVIPIPFTAILLIVVLYQKPAWFRNWVNEVYGR